MRPRLRFPRLGQRWIQPLVFVSLLNVLLWQGFTFTTVQPRALAGHADFISFYAASKIVSSGQGDRLYDVQTQQRWQQQVAGLSTPLLYYRPAFHLLLYLPLAAFSLEEAYFVFYGVNLAALLTLSWLLMDGAGALGNSWKWLLLAMAAFFPVSFALLQGQDSLVALLALTLVWRALRGQHDLTAGLLLALLLFKFQVALPMVAIFALAGRWKLVKGFAVGAVGVAAMSVAIVGWSGVMAYPPFLLEMNARGAHGTIHAWAMPNLRGFLESISGAADWTAGALALVSPCLLWWVSKAWRARTKDLVDINVRFALLMLVVLLVSHHQNPHDIALLALPLLLISDYLASAAYNSSNRALAILTAVLFLPTLYVLLLRWRALYLMAPLLLFYGILLARYWVQHTKAFPQTHATLAAEAS